jgi:hypothetical protein
MPVSHVAAIAWLLLVGASSASSVLLLRPLNSTAPTYWPVELCISMSAGPALYEKVLALIQQRLGGSKMASAEPRLAVLLANLQECSQIQLCKVFTAPPAQVSCSLCLQDKHNPKCFAKPRNLPHRDFFSHF